MMALWAMTSCAVSLSQPARVAEACSRGRHAVSRLQLVHSLVAFVAVQQGPLPAIAAARGAEDAYKTQAFDTRPCVRRTPLGACAEVGSEKTASPNTGLPEVVVPNRSAQLDPRLQVEGVADSELIRKLKQRTADNAEANAKTVSDITTKNGLGATFGPFSTDAPVLRQDGSTEIISVNRLKELKDRGLVTQTKIGLDIYAPGFDPDGKPPEHKVLVLPGFLEPLLGPAVGRL